MGIDYFVEHNHIHRASSPLDLQCHYVICCRRDALITAQSAWVLWQRACLKRLLAWHTAPLAVYSILNSRDISQDRLNSFSGSGVMDSMAFLMAGMKKSTCRTGSVAVGYHFQSETKLNCALIPAGFGTLCCVT